MSLYELAVLGSPSAEERAHLIASLTSLTEGFDLVLGRDIILHDAVSIGTRDKKAAFAAAYFASAGQPDLDSVQELLKANAPIIPTIGERGDFNLEVPDILRSANGLKRRSNDPEMVELATALLECVGLLRRQRRIFVSYRRLESRAAALQLHDLLAARGFDVFLDTHHIRPGDPFQEVLWHRLVDSDVLLMLDTPGYFESQWTRQEIGRARAKDIQVLRVIWPEHTPSQMTDLAETIHLRAEDLQGPDGPITDEAVDNIIVHAERLRSRSIFWRHMSITGKLKADVEKIGASIEGVGAYRAISIRLVDGQQVFAYPIVGVPTAEILNDIAEKAGKAEQGGVPVLVYDHVGIRGAWSAHLQWLDEQIKAVRALKVSEAGYNLAAWDS